MSDVLKAEIAPPPHQPRPVHTNGQATEVLAVQDLRVSYYTRAGAIKAVDGVSFSLAPGQRLGLVGESGSGKSTIALSVLRMIKPPGRIEGGQIFLDGVDLLTLSERQMRRTRLAKVALVAQGAMNSLNPVKRIRDQVRMALRDHDVEMSDEQFRQFLKELLEKVGLKPNVANMYPHELSGGMKQRVCIAIAISMEPRVIVADEPTSALDVVVQWQVIETLRKVQKELGAAVIQIGHDMGLMAHSVDRIGVMYAGKLVEETSVENMFREPAHPYAQLLIASLPSLETKGNLQGIPGLPPSLLHPIGGCPFHPRCPYAMDRCKVEMPLFLEVRPDHRAACHLYDEDVKVLRRRHDSVA
ncbi:MAG TPA: ABC transporter ATP-binding protein [Thermomicrobiales bacterium]|nr:ABC transporter ATP-binding protein [Thermomicrobiales bacterium]